MGLRWGLAEDWERHVPGLRLWILEGDCCEFELPLRFLADSDASIVVITLHKLRRRVVEIDRQADSVEGRRTAHWSSHTRQSVRLIAMFTPPYLAR